jgi:hypothetical protein
LHPVNPDRLRDVLDLLIAQIVETQRQLVADVVARSPLQCFALR